MSSSNVLRKTPVLSVVLWIVIFGAIGAAVWLVRGNVAEGKRRQAQFEQEMRTRKVPPVPVEVAILDTTSFSDTVQRPGLTEAWEEVLLASSREGIVEWVGFEEGDAIGEGDPVCRVETAMLQALVKQYVSALDYARRKLARTQDLVKDGVAPHEDLDRDLDELRRAEASLDVATENLRLATTVSPIRGVLESREVDPGEHLGVGQAIGLIVNLEKVKVRVAVPEREVAGVRVGQVVPITIDAFPGETFSSKVFRVSTVSDPVTRTFDVELELPNPNGRILSGMICRAVFTLRNVEDAILVPIYALMKRDSEVWAFVEENGVARKRPVAVGSFVGEAIEVVSGLSSGDRLIVTGQRELSDGRPVELVRTVEKNGVPNSTLIGVKEDLP